jgi:hypothetical protein
VGNGLWHWRPKTLPKRKEAIVEAAVREALTNQRRQLLEVRSDN